MSHLSENGVDIQNIAEAIATVLDIEVTIYDEKLVVVATSGGGMHNRIGSTVRGHVIKEVMKRKETIINEIPGKHSICNECTLFGSCPERADISCPIIIEDKTIGVISLTAFTVEQRKLLLKDIKGLQRFLEKISELIKSKLLEYKLVQELSLVVEKLETIFDCVNEAIIAIDSEGRITQLNSSAEKLFGLTYSKVYGNRLDDVMLNIPINEILMTGEGYTDIELNLQVNNSTISTMGSARVMKKGNTTKGVVLTFRDMKDVKKLVYEISSYQGEYSLDEIISVNSDMVYLKNKIKLISKSPSTVLIQGESGTGKELIARALHAESHKGDVPFIAINSAAIPEALLESELFGYDEGAFTGAKKKGKPGKFELAHGGTLFLDEIGDMPLYLQAKLLRVLQDRRVERVGGINPIQIDVRVIAATNRDLEKMVTTKEFREDLFFRLNVIPLYIPPLRERKEDIPVLVKHFLIKHKENLDKSNIEGFTTEAINILTTYNWPGNVRELENVIEYAVNFETGSFISMQSLPRKIVKKNNEVIEDKNNFNVRPLVEIEIEMIKKAIRIYGETLEGKKQVAEKLGIDLSTLYRKLKRINYARF